MFSRSPGLLAALLLCASTPAWGQQPATAPQEEGKAVTVNGKPMPKSRLEFIVKQRTAQGQPDSNEVRRMILDNLVTQEVVVQEAVRRGFAKNTEVQAQLDFLRQQVLVQALIQDYVKKHPVKDGDLMAEYEKLKAARSDKEYKARHILVDKDSEANEIIAQLKKGAKFEDLAKRSKDSGNKDKGGDLDWAAPDSYVKPFADALTRLEKGKYTESPVQTQYGWHVIQLDDVRERPFQSYDSLKPQLQTRLQQEEIQKYVSELRSKAKIQ